MHADASSPWVTHVRNRYLLISDIIAFAASIFLAYVVRFEGLDWGLGHARAALLYAALSIPLKVMILTGIGLYRRLWRYAGVVDLERILMVSVACGATSLFLGAGLLPGLGLTAGRVPLSVILMDALLSSAAIALPRLALRIFGRRGRPRSDARRTLVVGAGTTGEMIVKELLSHPQLGLYPIGIVDDDRSKHAQRLCGVPVLGSLDKLGDLVTRHDVEELVIAMPRASGKVVREVVQAALDCGIKARTVPSFQDILSGKVPVAALRQVEIQDLLRREPIQTDLEQVRSLA
ncbi:MAG: nucleoside-diphosphate sugar epimerase/dehydratase, partial [Gemmatimonadales bacterium]